MPLKRTSIYERVLPAVLLLAFFIAFHVSTLGVYFNTDEPMNIHSVWNPPLWKTAAAHLMFWSDFSRPMGVIYYLPVFKFAGFNPVPYNIVRTLFLLANTAIFYYLARSLTRSWWLATLAALPIAYHAGLSFLHYNGAFIYDVLCGGFYFAALLYYDRLRRNNTPWRLPQWAVFLALYICALNSKEMAVTFPVVLLAYEWLLKGRNARFGSVALTVAITAIYILGKTGPGTLTDIPEYRPVFTWARYAEANPRFLNSIFYTESFTMQRVLLLWAVVLYTGIRQLRLPRPDPRWLFLWVWVVVTPLPITFLPNRGGAMLYIVFAGWAMLAALFIRAVARRIARDIVFKGIPRKAIMLVALAGCVAAYVHETRRENRANLETHLSNGEDVRKLVDSLQGIGFRPAPGSKILLVNDPFPDTYISFFIATLVWEDPSLQILLQHYSRFSPEQMATMDYIFDFADNKLAIREPRKSPL